MVRDSVSFAQLMRRFRLQRGLSQGQLAQATRLSRTYIYHLETGMRQNPSTQVVQNFARVLALQESERQQLYSAFAQLTGQAIDDDPAEHTLLNVGHLAHLLVLNTSYPAHSLDRLWYVQTWNKASITLFEVEKEITRGEHIHLLELVFGTHRRQFFAWENMARRLVSDFQYTTSAMTHLPAYKELWKRLCKLPDFRRLASASSPEKTPAPSFVFSLQHNQLGRLVLRTAPTVFTHINSYSMVSYIPGDQSTLVTYRKYGWQPVDLIADDSPHMSSQENF